jgi:hypothetical protein
VEGESMSLIWGEDEDEADIAFETSDDEPREGDLITSDHVRFFECGFAGRDPVIVVQDGEDYREVVEAYMERTKYWPNVWFVSDHGNSVLLETWKWKEER